MSNVVSQIEAECAVGASRQFSEFAPLNSVRAFAFSELAQLAAMESFNCDDPDDEQEFRSVERGSRYEDGYNDRILLEKSESEERETRVMEYSANGQKNEPIDYRTDDSARMEAAMDTFLKFCDRLGDPSCPDVP